MTNFTSRPLILQCPACGATLALPNADTFECDYCGKLIMVPPQLRTMQAESAAIPVSIDSTEAIPVLQPSLLGNQDLRALQRRRSRFIIVVSIVILSLACGSLILFLFFMAVPTTRTSIQPLITPLRTTPLPTLVQFARLAMVFGIQGDQPGQFSDARSIAIDNQGNIFVADYTTGRINKFDPEGNFLQLIQVESLNQNAEPFIYNIATDAVGNLFVACDGSILKYDTASGELLLTIPDQWPDIYFQSVAVAPDGNLYSSNGMAGADDVIILDPQGQLLAHWTDTIENVNQDDPALDLALVVNHYGMVYILSPFSNTVYIYNPDGTFENSFGEEGDRAGQFSLSTGMMAVNEIDQLVISDVYRVDLFDADGNYLNRTFTIDYNVGEGSMYNMAIDTQGDLYFISSGGKVLKYEMNYP